MSTSSSLQLRNVPGVEGRTDDARQEAQRIQEKKPTMPRYLQRLERPWFRKASTLLKRLPKS